MTGKFKQSFSDDVFMEVLKKSGVLSTKEVAGQVGCSYNLAYKRLKALRKKGRVSGRLIGKSYAWWI